MKSLLIVLGSVLTASWAAGTGLAEEPKEASAEGALPQAQSDKDAPLNLWADQIVYGGDEFTCTGNVILTRGTSRIECEKVVGTIKRMEKEENGVKSTETAITHLVATGSPITMTSGERRARCLKAEYDLVEGKLILTGSKEAPPEIVEGGNVARGERIIFLVNEDPVKIVIEKGPIEIPLKGGAIPGLPK